MEIDGYGWLKRILWYAALSIILLIASKMLGDHIRDPLVFKLGLLGTTVFFFPLVISATRECLIKPRFSTPKEQEEED